LRQLVDNERITKFFRDRELLEHYNDAAIASKMGMAKSNYSSYVNRRKTVTNSFLRKFYNQFGKELREIAGKNAPHIKETEDNDEKPDTLTSDLEERCKNLERMQDRLVETNHLLSKEIYRLAAKMDRILDERLNKIEKLLFQLANDGSEDTSPSKSPSTTYKKKPGDG